MKQPTSKEIEEAKDYLRQRLNAELSMKNNLLAIMYQAAKEIIAVSYKYNVPTSQFSFSYNKELQEEVETIIANLRELIEDYTETLAVATHTDEKNISFLLSTERVMEKLLLIVSTHILPNSKKNWK